MQLFLHALYDFLVHVFHLLNLNFLLLDFYVDFVGLLLVLLNLHLDLVALSQLLCS